MSIGCNLANCRTCKNKLKYVVIIFARKVKLLFTRLKKVIKFKKKPNVFDLLSSSGYDDNKSKTFGFFLNFITFFSLVNNNFKLKYIYDHKRRFMV